MAAYHIWNVARGSNMLNFSSCCIPLYAIFFLVLHFFLCHISMLYFSLCYISLYAMFLFMWYFSLCHIYFSPGKGSIPGSHMTLGGSVTLVFFDLGCYLFLLYLSQHEYLWRVQLSHVPLALKLHPRTMSPHNLKFLWFIPSWEFHCHNKGWTLHFHFTKEKPCWLLRSTKSGRRELLRWFKNACLALEFGDSYGENDA